MLFSIFYFVIFTVLSALILLTLFIGVVTTSMEEATADMEDKKEVEERVAELRVEHNLSNLEMDTYQQIFSWLDMDQGGTIDEDELVTFLEAAGVADIEEGKELMKTLDMDVDGEANFAEFLEFLLTMKEDIVKGERKVELRVLKRKEIMSPGENSLNDGLRQLEMRDSIVLDEIIKEGEEEEVDEIFLQSVYSETDENQKEEEDEMMDDVI